jgi:hypothetical protein
MLPFLYHFNGFPHFTQPGPMGGCCTLHLGQVTSSEAPQTSHCSAKKVSLPHVGQLMCNGSPQWAHNWKSFSTVSLHLGHLSGPNGVFFPQYGQTFASGGTSLLQYAHGCL